MNKKTCILCGAILIVGISLTEGIPAICESCEKKKQPHIEVSQPTGIVQQVGSIAVAGISSTVTTTTMPPELLKDSE